MNHYHKVVQKICLNLIRQRDRMSCTLYNMNTCVLSSVTTSSDYRRFSTLTCNGTASVNLNVLMDKLPATFHQPCRDYAARKGTRARKAAKKVKKVEVKQPFIFEHLKKLAALPYEKLRPYDDSHLPIAVDDVYFFRKFQSQCYDFEKIVKFLRETHHPTVYNVPNAPLYLRVNLDMKYPNRATKCMDGWRSVIEMKTPFLLEGMIRPSVLAFCIEDVDYIDNVKTEGGADLAGGKELIKAIQAGDVNPDEFEYIVAHPSVVPELAVIRGLIKKKFPNVKSRTISTDLVKEIKRLKSGIKIKVVKNDREPDFAYIETPIGTLDMDGLVENFKSIVEDTLPRRISGKSPRDFIISCVLKTPGNGFEEFKVDMSQIFHELEETRRGKTSTTENADKEDSSETDVGEEPSSVAIQ